jgi:hypothetical protein
MVRISAVMTILICVCRGFSLSLQAYAGIGTLKQATNASVNNPKVHLLYEPDYVMSRVGNLTEENSPVTFDIPTGVWMLKVRSKYNLVTL